MVWTLFGEHLHELDQVMKITNPIKQYYHLVNLGMRETSTQLDRYLAP